MSVAEIKQTKLNLIAWIEQLSDTNTLTFLEGLKESRSSNDWWDELSDTQKENINEGLKDAQEGRTVSSAEFWKILKNG
jgi:predicted transcriptional regulator